MAKKKNTKSTNRFPDVLAAALCLAGAAFCLAGFWVDLNRSLEKYSEQPLGTVSWKRRAAQRRFTGRVLWDRLRQDSPVYPGDYIRTGELSAALISFASGGDVELTENSLIQIFSEGETPRVQIREGALSVSARNTDLFIAAGDTNVRVNSGGTVSLRVEDEALRVHVEDGSASLSAAGDTREAAAGDGFSLSSGALESLPLDSSVSAAPEAPPQAPPVLFTPEEGEVIRYEAELPRIRFRWNSPAADDIPPAYYILEAADNPGLENPALSLQTKTSAASASVPAPGLWYWRVRPVYAGHSGAALPAGSGGSRGSFLVEKGPPPAPPVLFVPPPEDTAVRTIFPPDGYTAAEALLQDLRFTWKAPAGAVRFQISDGEDFSRLEVDESVSGKTWQPRRLSPGTWYWRISAAGQASPARRFSVAPSLAAPVPVGELQNGVITAGQDEDSVFRWQPLEGAAYYEFRLYEGRAGGRLLHSETLAGTSARLSLGGYKEGLYRWTVQAFVNQSAASTRQESIAATVQFELKKTPQAGEATADAAAQEAAAQRAQAQAAQEAAQVAARIQAAQRAQAQAAQEQAAAQAAQRAQAQAAQEAAQVAARIQAAQEQAAQRAQAQAAQEAAQAAAAQAAAEEAAQAVPRIVPLHAPRLDAPAKDFLFNAERLRGITSISFSWAPVEDAGGYEFVLFSADGKQILSARPSGASWLLEDLSVLSKGQFRWQVRALRQGPGGQEQGPAAESFFTVDIPEVRRNRLEDIGNMYGR